MVLLTLEYHDLIHVKVYLVSDFQSAKLGTLLDDSDDCIAYQNTIVDGVTKVEIFFDSTDDSTAVYAHGDIFRTDGNLQRILGSTLVGDAEVRTPDESTIAALLAGDEIDKTDEVGNHLVGRAGVNIVGSTNLLNNTHAHDNDTVTHGHCFALVVGYIDNGDTKLLLNSADFKAHTLTELCIKVTERLVQKEKTGTHYKGASQRHTLLLTAGKLIGIAVAVFAEANHLQHFLYPGLTLFLGNLLYLERIAYILCDSHVRPYGVALEYHAYSALLRGYENTLLTAAYYSVIDDDVAFGSPLKAGNHTEGSSLSAAGGAEEADKLTFLNINVEIPYSSYIAEAFVEVFYSYLCQFRSLLYQMPTLPLVNLFRIRLPTSTISRMMTDRTEAF